MKFVLDTNIIVSFSTRQKGAVVSLWKVWMEKRFTLITCEAAIEEFNRALRYPKVQALHHWSEAHIKVFVANIRYRAIFTPGTTPVEISVRDTTDTKFLACGDETKADAIVTGDPDLLSLHRYKGIPIVSPKDCMERFFPALLRTA